MKLLDQLFSSLNQQGTTTTRSFLQNYSDEDLLSVLQTHSNSLQTLVREQQNKKEHPHWQSIHYPERLQQLSQITPLLFEKVSFQSLLRKDEGIS
jgi:hypothetical protein